MSAKTKRTRYWRYEVTEVWGDMEGRIEVGAVIVDRWKHDRVWAIYNMKRLGDGPIGGWRGRLIGEVTEPESLAQLETRVSPTGERVEWSTASSPSGVSMEPSLCEFCDNEIQPDSLWMSNEACYCSASCRKDGQLAASGADVERNGITRWGEDHAARMARLKVAADADMELDRATPTLFSQALEGPNRDY